MDPLTIASTVITISSHCIQTAQSVANLRDKYKNAQVMITAIYTELTVVSASLGHIQGLTTKDSVTLQSTLQMRPELKQTFDQALTGCVLIFTVLDDEVRKLQEGTNKILSRVNYLWKEESMKDLLQQIRGQQTALGLLIQAFQMSSVADIKTLLQNNNAVLGQVAQRTYKLRQAHPKIRSPPSVFEKVFDDAASIATYDSTASSTAFSFDDYLVNAQAYRRALAASRSDLSRKSSGSKDSGEHSEDETIVAASPSINGPTGSVPKLIKEALLSQETTIVEVKKKPESVEGVEFRILGKDWTELKYKYGKVKKCYFDKVAEVNQKQEEKEKAQAEWNKEKKWLESRLEGVEHTNSFLQKKIKDLELIDEENKRYFREEEAKRIDLNDNHNSLLADKEERINELKEQLERSREKAEQESQKASERQSNIKTLEEKISSIESDEESAKNLLVARDEQIKQLTTEVSIKEEELERYKGFDAIINQLRALSPASSPLMSSQSPLA